MIFFQLLLISFSLAMDSLSFSIVGGSRKQEHHFLNGLKTAFFFGFFQAVMPLIGWLIGYNVISYIFAFDHWVAFGILSFIGVKMIREQKKEGAKKINLLNGYTLLILAIATSIDAMVVGFTLALGETPLLASVTVIGLVTFSLCLLGYLFGHKLGSYIKNRMEMIGGIVLISLGTKILLEHLLG